jgi:hypothetical protein
MKRQYVQRNGYGNVGTQTLYLVNLERRVCSFNNRVREAGIDLRISLTGNSEEYAYYADLILPNKHKIPFLIYPACDWGLYGKPDDFSQEDVDWYYKAWYLWKS